MKHTVLIEGGLFVPFAIIGLMDSGFGTFRIWLPGGQKARPIKPHFFVKNQDIFNNVYECNR
jgi:hypothetical protein